MGNAPRTPRMPPSSDSSPTNKQSETSFLFSPPYAPRMPSAMGRSNPEPSLRISAGARLIVIWVGEYRSRNSSRQREPSLGFRARPRRVSQLCGSGPPASLCRKRPPLLQSDWHQSRKLPRSKFCRACGHTIGWERSEGTERACVEHNRSAPSHTVIAVTGAGDRTLHLMPLSRNSADLDF